MSGSNTEIKITARSFKLAFQKDTPVNIEDINQEILESVGRYEVKAVVGYTYEGRAVTIEELAENGISEDIPEDGKEVLKVLTFDFEPDKIFVIAGDTTFPLSRLKLTVGYRKVENGSPQGTKPGEAAKPVQFKQDYITDVFVKQL